MKSLVCSILLFCVPITLYAFSITPSNLVSHMKAFTQDSQKIDLNQADANVLSHTFKGIGPKRAEAIVEHRKIHGPFKSVASLSEVKGISRSFVKQHLEELEKMFTAG